MSFRAKRDREQINFSDLVPFSAFDNHMSAREYKTPPLERMISMNPVQ